MTSDIYTPQPAPTICATCEKAKAANKAIFHTAWGNRDRHIPYDADSEAHNSIMAFYRHHYSDDKAVMWLLEQLDTLATALADSDDA